MNYSPTPLNKKTQTERLEEARALVRTHMKADAQARERREKSCSRPISSGEDDMRMDEARRAARAAAKAYNESKKNVR